VREEREDERDTSGEREVRLKEWESGTV